MYNSKLDSFTNLQNKVPHGTKRLILEITMTRLTKFYFGSSTNKYSNKVINCYNIPLFHVHSDASNTGIACVFSVRGKRNICYRNVTDLEKTFSSTWRELEAIRFSLLSLIKQFESKCIFWYTDNFATQQIKCGSNKTHIYS